MKEVKTVRIENEIELEADIERVFKALTSEQLAWYPHTYGGERVKRLVFEERVGGLCYEDWGDGQGALYGVVTYFDRPNAYCLRGHLGGGVNLESWIRLASAGQGKTVLRSSTVCFGEISDDDEKGIRFHGDLSNYTQNLKDYLSKV